MSPGCPKVSLGRTCRRRDLGGHLKKQVIVHPLEARGSKRVLRGLIEAGRMWVTKTDTFRTRFLMEMGLWGNL